MLGGFDIIHDVLGITGFTNSAQEDAHGCFNVINEFLSQTSTYSGEHLQKSSFALCAKTKKITNINWERASMSLKISPDYYSD